ncbi:MAG TPA: hypothetical protein VMG13_20970, partial [Trebonia sp.]|nr:hypothetical protein [Trebonia sp.]
IDGTAAYSNGGHVGAALRRRRKLWCITAVAGLVIAMGAYVKYPPSYQATTSVLLVNNPTLDESEQIATDASLVTSGAVVQRVIGQLGLNESVGKFISSVVVTPPVTTTTDVITIAVSAPSSSDAVREANALSTDFLQFRAQMLQSQLQLDAGLLGQQISQAKSQADTINKQLSQLAQTPENQAEINNLQGQVDLATTTESNASATETTDQLNTSNMIKGSQVVNSAIVAPHTFKKDLGFYLAVGLVAGLVLGMAYVAIAALVSSRVRRRDDVADAIGAPVRLSVASADLAPVADTKRVVALLNGLVPEGSNGIRALAVVAVDNADIAARAVVALSQELSSRGEKVLLADLSDGTAAARILQVTTPGVRMVSTTGGPGIVVAVPEPDDIAPAGPLSGDLPPVGRVGERPPEPSVASAYSGADLLLTLATLDPATGGSHLATWATDAAVIVTAGKSSATKLNAVGEMIRLAGIRLGTVVLTGADKSDETVGLASRAADQYSPAS